MENVPEAIDEKNKRSPWCITRDLLLKNGFSIAGYRSIPMTKMGCPSSRRRAIIRAWRVPEGEEPVWELRDEPKFSVKIV